MSAEYSAVISHYWECPKREAFQHIDTALYLFLANEWNLREQPEWFGIETRYLEIAVPISRKSLVFSRERLRARGLIDYEAKGGRVQRCTLFVFPQETQTGTQTIFVFLRETLLETQINLCFLRKRYWKHKREHKKRNLSPHTPL